MSLELTGRLSQAHAPQVTYRLLSRALKVNVTTAKQYVYLIPISAYDLMPDRMLYEFHTKQNSKKPKSIHATYILTGKKRALEHTNGANGQDGDDAVMRSSPFMSSMPAPEEPAEDPVSKTSVVLVREEELESMNASGTSIWN